MEEYYGDDFITITDEDGVEYELEVLARTTYQGKEYIAVTPANASNEDEELEVSVLKEEMEDGEPILCAVEDDDELEAVYELLMDTMEDEEDEENEE